MKVFILKCLLERRCWLHNTCFNVKTHNSNIKGPALVFDLIDISKFKFCFRQNSCDAYLDVTLEWVTKYLGVRTYVFDLVGYSCIILSGQKIEEMQLASAILIHLASPVCQCISCQALSRACFSVWTGWSTEALRV